MEIEKNPCILGKLIRKYNIENTYIRRGWYMVGILSGHSSQNLLYQIY